MRPIERKYQILGRSMGEAQDFHFVVEAAFGDAALGRFHKLLPDLGSEQERLIDHTLQSCIAVGKVGGVFNIMAGYVGFQYLMARLRWQLDPQRISHWDEWSAVCSDFVHEFNGNFEDVYEFQDMLINIGRGKATMDDFLLFKLGFKCEMRTSIG